MEQIEQSRINWTTRDEENSKKLFKNTSSQIYMFEESKYCEVVQKYSRMFGVGNRFFCLFFSGGTMTECDFFRPREADKCHWKAFSEHKLMYDPTRYLEGHCIMHSPGPRQRPSLVVVPEHWVTAAEHIL